MAAAVALAQVPTPSTAAAATNPRRARAIPKSAAAGRAPRWIPKRGQVLKNVLKLMFSSCLPFGQPRTTTRDSSSTKPSTVFPSSH